mgnify:CR=1 FL=1
MNNENTGQLNKNTLENGMAKPAAMPPAPKKWKLMFVSWLFVYPVINIMFAVVFPLVIGLLFNVEGVIGLLKRGACVAGAFATFARLYLHPVKRNDIPQSVRMAPAW